MDALRAQLLVTSARNLLAANAAHPVLLVHSPAGEMDDEIILGVYARRRSLGMAVLKFLRSPRAWLFPCSLTVFPAELDQSPAVLLQPFFREWE